MHIRFFVISLVLLFTCACDSKPTCHNINEQQLLEMLVDIHLTDGALAEKNIYSRKDKHLPSFYYNSIYEKHGISQAQFDSCISLYAQNSQLLNQLYDKVIDSLNRMETKIKMKLKQPVKKSDTLNLNIEKRKLDLPINKKQ